MWLQEKQVEVKGVFHWESWEGVIGGGNMIMEKHWAQGPVQQLTS